jgi:hypothetical protein
MFKTTTKTPLRSVNEECSVDMQVVFAWWTLHVEVSLRINKLCRVKKMRLFTSTGRINKGCRVKTIRLYTSTERIYKVCRVKKIRCLPVQREYIRCVGWRKYVVYQYRENI